MLPLTLCMKEVVLLKRIATEPSIVSSIPFTSLAWRCLRTTVSAEESIQKHHGALARKVAVDQISNLFELK